MFQDKLNTFLWIYKTRPPTCPENILIRAIYLFAFFATARMGESNERERSLPLDTVVIEDSTASFISAFTTVKQELCPVKAFSDLFSQSVNNPRNAHNALFICPSGQMVRTRAVYGIIRDNLCKAGINEDEAAHFTIHSFRHTSTTDMSGSESDKMKRGGWKSIRMMRKYDH